MPYANFPITPPATHISEVVDYYMLLIKLITEGIHPGSGEKGYSIAAAHKSSWWETMEALAKSLPAHGLDKEPTAAVRPSVELAEQALGFSSPYVQAAFGSRSACSLRHLEELLDLTGKRPAKCRGNKIQHCWELKWTDAGFFNIVDDEVQSVLKP
ncbi:hypothetical protein M440DRAFT_1405040 [Trichoderma longibrachiatum ATCC 18648]|uniref:Uncharacterized protein n=1 Tax=Trichoderma longibrachiatum ATCC 18648 TaxID=983965 RepID=A0A2T4BTH0_TRILO|nr:hypothetical protein M440DRAFT_1405040 [Trichoderma longibrachiatum ATCC 18648]